MGTNSRRVLVIEEERDIARLWALHLEDLGCEVDPSYDGSSGLARALDGTAWSLLVLDLRLPELDGLEICRRVRSSTTYTPILMLTARASELDRVLGLETGADDYLVKPFSIVEFAARVKAILRRVEQLARQSPVQRRSLRAGELAIDLDRRIAKREGHALLLRRSGPAAPLAHCGVCGGRAAAARGWQGQRNRSVRGGPSPDDCEPISGGLFVSSFRARAQCRDAPQSDATGFGAARPDPDL